MNLESEKHLHRFDEGDFYDTAPRAAIQNVGRKRLRVRVVERVRATHLQENGKNFTQMNRDRLTLRPEGML